MNPYRNLLEAGLLGNINNEYVKAVEAINYLAPEKHNDPIPIHSKRTYCSFSEFLTEKLSENLRRIYSNKRNKGGYHNEKTDYDTLKKFQTNIYKLLTETFTDIKLPPPEEKHKYTFLGAETEANKETALFLLSFHEHICPENEESHIKLLKKINLENINLKDGCLEHIISKISIKSDKLKFNNKVLSILPEKTIHHIINSIHERSLGTFAPILLAHCINTNFNLTGDEKAKLLNNTCSLVYPRLKEAFLISAFKSVEDKIESYLADTNGDALNENIYFVNSNLSKFIVPKAGKKAINNPNFFARYIENIVEGKGNLNPQVNFDIDNQSLLIDTAIMLKKSSKTHINATKLFLTKTLNHQTKETLAQIIAMNANIYGELQPIFMKYKLNDSLEKEPTESKQKKYKI